jgi:hypothetical protein
MCCTWGKENNNQVPTEILHKKVPIEIILIFVSALGAQVPSSEV